MGNDSSKEPEPATSQDTTNKQANHNTIHEENGGFHLIELHLPTVNFGAGMFVLLIFVCGIAYFVLKYRRQRRLQNLRYQLAGHGGFPFAAEEGGFRRPGFPVGGFGAEAELLIANVLRRQQLQQPPVQEPLAYRRLEALEREVARRDVLAGRESARPSEVASFEDESSFRKHTTIP